MKFHYTTYGLSIFSDIELPALLKCNTKDSEQPISVWLGDVPHQLVSSPMVEKPFTVYNAEEWLYRIPNVANYYVRNGSEVIIEPLSENWNEILLYFYANCLAAILFQRNLIPLHVSGVFIDKNRVLLFAAPSRTGKSTTSVMLQQRGYPLFTDDTAVLSIENGKCFAQSSYPMIRLWQNTIDVQQVLDESTKLDLSSDAELDKYGFMFHQNFVTSKVEVAGIVFLDAEGVEISIHSIKPNAAIQLLGNNIYRKQWLNGMKKQVLQFKHLTGIINAIPVWKAIRPKTESTFESFAESIEEQIINLLNNNNVVAQ